MADYKNEWEKKIFNEVGMLITKQVSEWLDL